MIQTEYLSKYTKYSLASTNKCAFVGYSDTANVRHCYSDTLNTKLVNSGISAISMHTQQ